MGLASKHAAFRRPGVVPVLFQGGTVLLISVSTYRASKSFFIFYLFLKSSLMERAFLIVPERFTF